MEQAIEKKWDQPGEMVKALLAETHLEVWKQFQLFIEKERPREHEACRIEAAEEEEMVGPPPKKAKDEKAEEMTENVQEESVDYNEFYSNFSQRALDTIGNQFDLIQIALTTMACLVKLKGLNALLGTLICCKRYLPWCSKLKRRTRG